MMNDTIISASGRPTIGSRRTIMRTSIAMLVRYAVQLLPVNAVIWGIFVYLCVVPVIGWGLAILLSPVIEGVYAYNTRVISGGGAYPMLILTTGFGRYRTILKANWIWIKNYFTGSYYAMVLMLVGEGVEKYNKSCRYGMLLYLLAMYPAWSLDQARAVSSRMMLGEDGALRNYMMTYRVSLTYTLLPIAFVVTVIFRIRVCLAVAFLLFFPYIAVSMTIVHKRALDLKIATGELEEGLADYECSKRGGEEGTEIWDEA